MDERPQEWMDGNGETRDALRLIHTAMKGRGLFDGPQDDYWYHVWDSIVAEIAPELQDE